MNIQTPEFKEERFWFLGSDIKKTMREGLNIDLLTTEQKTELDKEYQIKIKELAEANIKDNNLKRTELFNNTLKMSISELLTLLNYFDNPNKKNDYEYKIEMLIHYGYLKIKKKAIGTGQRGAKGTIIDCVVQKQYTIQYNFGMLSGLITDFFTYHKFNKFGHNAEVYRRL